MARFDFYDVYIVLTIFIKTVVIYVHISIKPYINILSTRNWACPECFLSLYKLQ